MSEFTGIDNVVSNAVIPLDTEAAAKISLSSSLWKLLEEALGPGAQIPLEDAVINSMPSTTLLLGALPRDELQTVLRSALGGVSTRAWNCGANGVVHALLAVQAAAPARNDADEASMGLLGVLRAPVASLLDSAALLRGAAAAADTPSEALGLWLAVSARLSAPHALDAAPIERLLAADRWERAELPGTVPETYKPRPPPSPRPARGDAPASALDDDAAINRRLTPPALIDPTLPLLVASLALADGALAIAFEQSPPLNAAGAMLTLDLLLIRAHPTLHAHLAHLGVSVPSFALPWLSSAGFACATGEGGVGEIDNTVSAFSVTGIPFAQTRAGARWAFATLIAEGWAGWARITLGGLLAVANDLLAFADATDALSYLATFPRRGALNITRIIEALAAAGATPSAAAAALLISTSLRLTLSLPLGGRAPTPAAAYAASLAVSGRVSDARSYSSGAGFSNGMTIEAGIPGTDLIALSIAVRAAGAHHYKLQQKLRQEEKEQEEKEEEESILNDKFSAAVRGRLLAAAATARLALVNRSSASPPPPQLTPREAAAPSARLSPQAVLEAASSDARPNGPRPKDNSVKSPKTAAEVLHAAGVGKIYIQQLAAEVHPSWSGEILEVTKVVSSPEFTPRSSNSTPRTGSSWESTLRAAAVTPRKRVASYSRPPQVDPVAVLEAASSPNRPNGVRPESSRRAISPMSPEEVLSASGLTPAVLARRAQVESDRIATRRASSPYFAPPDAASVLDAAAGTDRPLGVKPLSASRAVVIPSGAHDVLRAAGVDVSKLGLSQETIKVLSEGGTGMSGEGADGANKSKATPRPSPIRATTVSPIIKHRRARAAALGGSPKVPSNSPLLGVIPPAVIAAALRAVIVASTALPLGGPPPVPAYPAPTEPRLTALPLLSPKSEYTTMRVHSPRAPHLREPTDEERAESDLADEKYFRTLVSPESYRDDAQARVTFVLGRKNGNRTDHNGVAVPGAALDTIVNGLVGGGSGIDFASASARALASSSPLAAASSSFSSSTTATTTKPQTLPASSLTVRSLSPQNKLSNELISGGLLGSSVEMRNDSWEGAELLESIRTLRLGVASAPLEALAHVARGGSSNNTGNTGITAANGNASSLAPPALVAHWRGEILDVRPAVIAPPRSASPTLRPRITHLLRAESALYDDVVSMLPPVHSPAVAVALVYAAAGVSPLRATEELVDMLRGGGNTTRSSRLSTTAVTATSSSLSSLSASLDGPRPPSVSRTRTLFDNAIRAGFEGATPDSSTIATLETSPIPPPKLSPSPMFTTMSITTAADIEKAANAAADAEADFLINSALSPRRRPPQIPSPSLLLPSEVNNLMPNNNNSDSLSSLTQYASPSNYTQRGLLKLSDIKIGSDLTLLLRSPVGKTTSIFA